MILKEGHELDYLLKYREGKIKPGLGIGCELDEYLRFKRKQLNIVLGHDNVGKTYWLMWYFLVLATQHDLRFAIWAGENNSGQIMRDLIQMYSGQRYMALTEAEIQRYYVILNQNFKFVSNENLYKPNELLKIFEEANVDACLIDPFTGLDREIEYKANYKFLNDARQFVNKTGITLYISTHPTSESGRSGMIYGEDNQEWKGHLKPPLKDHIEGGKPFLNRCDDMIVVHRLVKHETMRYETMVNVEKVKDTDTGGKQTQLHQPILFNFNSGLGFKNGYVDPIKRLNSAKPKETIPTFQQLDLNKHANTNFDNFEKNEEELPF
jgi:hypothetical protein